MHIAHNVMKVSFQARDRLQVLQTGQDPVARMRTHAGVHLPFRRKLLPDSFEQALDADMPVIGKPLVMEEGGQGREKLRPAS